MQFENIITKDQSNPLKSLIFRYFPYWPLFAILSLLFLGLAWLYLQISPKLYESSATVLIKDEKKGVSNPGMETLNIYTSKKIVENEIEVMKSKTIIRETVKKLNLSSPIFEKTPFAYISAYSQSPLSVEVKFIDKIKEIDNVPFFYDPNNNVIKLENASYKLNEWINSSYGDIRFVKNTHLMQIGNGPFFFSLIDPRKATYQLLKNLSVKPVSKLSTVVNLYFTDTDPTRGEDIVNTLLDFYNNATIEDKNRLAANTLEFVEDRIRLVEHDLDSLERSIQQYKSTRGIVNLSEQGKLFLERVGNNDERLSQINIQMAVLDKVEEFVVKNENRSGIVPSTLGIYDEGLSILIQKLYSSEIQYERLKKTTAENNPILLSLQNEIQNMRPGILENIRNQRLSLIASRTNLSSTNKEYASALHTIPQRERELLDVNRQQAIKNNVYTFLLQKKEETVLSYASSMGESRIVDRAESTVEPIAPKKLIIYLGAITVAFFLVIVWVLLKELFNTKILFRSEIETNTKVPIIAEIFQSKTKDHIVIHHPKMAFFNEQFWHLRAAEGLNRKNIGKIVMITSSIPGEGKSFISVNFATSLAYSKKKVLLIDFDLRNPKLSNFFNAIGSPGVAEILDGSRDVESVIRSTEIQNLLFVSAGQNLSNPNDILSNANFQRLFERLIDRFDFIIIDTPPVNPVTDAFIIAPFCDATLFVVRHSKTPKIMIRLLDEKNRRKELNNVSIVFNGVKERGVMSKAFGYGYGYSYVYSKQQNLK